MMLRLVPRVLAGLASCAFFLSFQPLQALTSPAEIHAITNLTPVMPGPADGRIAYATAKMLEQYQYLRQPFNTALSGKFLDRYLEALDPQHLHFVQADLNEFEHYRTNLDRLTTGRKGMADTMPACEIFNRFMERLKERVEYADQILKEEKFTFDDPEKIVINRHDLPYPKDITEARKLWRERLRYEYLQEKLAKLGAKKKSQTSNNLPEKIGEPTEAKQAKKSEPEEITDTLKRRYNRNLRTFAEWDNDDVLQVYLTTLTHVYDPHSDYFGHAQLDSFSISMNLSLFGIGAELRSEDGYCSVNRLLPGGPALKSSKIKEKDRIIAVAQSNQPPVDVVDMTLSKVVQLIRGPKGTEVRLTVAPAGSDSSASTVISLVRDEIKLVDQQAKAKVVDMPDASGGIVRLGVVDLPSFYASFDPANTKERSEPKSTAADVAKLLEKLKKENVKGVILDLRRNGGGSLEEAIRVTGLFIKQGPVVQVRSWNGSVEADDDTDAGVVYDGPLIVLTSRFSASASEILAGALQDYGRALIVGDSSTHGKGTVQSVNPLRPLFPNWTYTNDPGAVKLTIKKFYRASGASTQLKGVVPDVVLPSLANELKEVGESSLDNPLPWDTIPAAKYDQLNRVAPYVNELARRSTDRIGNDKEFAYIREDIEQLKKAQADKTVSLNEQDRLKEKSEMNGRQKARTHERLARKEGTEKTYELSLEQADLPGLPPPVEKTNSIAKLSSGNGVSAGDSASLSLSDVTGDEEAADDEKAPTPDATMVESERILIDYVSLLASRSLAAAEAQTK